MFLDTEVILHPRSCVVDMRSPRNCCEKELTDATKDLAITCTTLKRQKGGKHEIYIYCWKKKRVNRNEKVREGGKGNL